MKTAEEWIKIIQCQSGYMGSNALVCEDDILSIQLDAWKQGMSDALEVIMDDNILYPGITIIELIKNADSV